MFKTYRGQNHCKSENSILKTVVTKHLSGLFPVEPRQCFQL